MKGQITLQEWIKPDVIPHCGDCVCRSCMYWWSKRCPYGECYDDHRAVVDPYDKADKPPRTWWSNWKKPGEQAHWCRGGMLHPVKYCEHFVKYKGQQVKECLKANVSVFQDGYIQCSLLNSIGCEQCYRELEEKIKREERKDAETYG